MSAVPALSTSTVTFEQAMKVVSHALRHAHEFGDCLFCTMSGTDVRAWHAKDCPLAEIDPVFPPKRRAPPKRSTGG